MELPFYISSLWEPAQYPLQKADYRYNIRGWLKGINDPDQLGDDLFALQLNYELTEDFSPFGNYATPLYNGNISQAHWKTANDNSGVSRAYTYHYDALNRIKSAAYHRMPGIPSFGALSYSLGPVSYDRNGNITGLKRQGFTNDNTPLGAPPMDDLSYHYRPNSNRLKKVSDAGNAQYGFKDGNTTGSDYAYDANGNLTKDLNKHITNITYNVLNLPKKITVTGNNGGTIRFYYTATGQKVQKTVQSNSGTTTTLYDHGFIYKGGELQFFAQPEGYIKSNNNGSFTYVFQYKDQLGNIRLSYKNTYNGTILNPDVAVVEAHDYYPFGLEHKGYNETPNNDEYPFKYNGKELEDALGLDWYDYGARWYDAAIGRWLGVDPKASKYPGWSPYNYALDNPVRFEDPNGKNPLDIIIVGSNGNTITIPTAGKDRYVPIPYAISKSRTLNLGLSNISTKNLAAGYSINAYAEAKFIAGRGVSAGLTVVNYFNHDYGNYNYVYAQAAGHASAGGQAGAEAGIQANFFVMYNTNKSTTTHRPATFQGSATAIGLTADIKDVAGLGISISGFKSGDWIGAAVGLNIGVGESANLGNFFIENSTSVLLNNQKRTRCRSVFDRYVNQSNFSLMVLQAGLQYLKKTGYDQD